MNYPITVTLAALRAKKACVDGYNNLVRALQDAPFTKKDKNIGWLIDYAHGEPIPLTFILESNGLSDALRSLCASNASERDIRMLSISFARRVEHLDKTGTAKKLNDVNERFANGQATIGELKEAQEAARWAWEAGSARSAVRAVRAADAAALSADAAEQAAAWAADAAALSADTARSAVAWEAEAQAQRELFIQMCNGEAPWQEGALLSIFDDQFED